MQFKKIHPNFILPTRGTEESAGLDLYLPTNLTLFRGGYPVMYPLGFAAAIPKGFVGLILPRSGVGAKYGVELNNTCGVIDSDYRGEWKASIKLKETGRTPEIVFKAGERVLQLVVVPVTQVTPTLVDELESTERHISGFGSTGK